MLSCQRQPKRKRTKAAEIFVQHHGRLCGGAVRPGDPRPRRLFRQPTARPAHPADRRPDERHPHPARCAGGSRCHAGRRPAAGSAGARTAGTAGAADVRESRSHELIRRFFAHKQQQMQKPLHGWCSGPCYRTERFACRSPMLITSQNTQRLLVESWVSLW